MQHIFYFLAFYGHFDLEKLAKIWKKNFPQEMGIKFQKIEELKIYCMQFKISVATDQTWRLVKHLEDQSS